MAFLTPDKTRTEHGLLIRERIIPDSARATRYVASYVPQGGKMKPCAKLSGGTGKVGGVTIHNTADIDESTGTNDAEQYSRATWPNQAMGGVMVHYYLDEVEAWQNLCDDEQGWHAADGNGPGNTTTIAIEIIMDGSGSKEDIGAENNGALLSALLLHKHGLGIDKLYTHNRWMGLPDNIVYGKPKNCPLYILPHWDAFKAKVQKHLSELRGAEEEPPDPENPVDTVNYTMICGSSVATVAQMRAYLKKANPKAPDYSQFYFQEGAAEGIRGDIAFAQSCVETGYWKFGGDVKPAQNNFCGLGATGGGVAGASFDTPLLGIRAQIQHLKAYASAEPLAGACVDPRFCYISRACAPYVEWLGIPDNPQGKGWAAGNGYGKGILKVLHDIINTAEEEMVSKAEYDALKVRYEEIRKRYDAEIDGLKAAVSEAQTLAENLKTLYENAR